MKLTALITGPSSGIGLDLAHLFAADGHDVVLVARSEGKLRAVASELESKHHISARVIVADLARPDAPREVFAAAPPVDVLVNNAGFGTSGPFAETAGRTELEIIQVNVAALTHLTKLFLPLPHGQGSFRPTATRDIPGTMQRLRGPRQTGRPEP